MGRASVLAPGMIPLSIALVVVCVATPVILGRLMLKLLGTLLEQASVAQERAATSMTEAMSTAARSITAPYSISTPGTDGKVAPVPAAGAIWEQNDDIDPGDFSDPTDDLMPDPGYFRPEARMQAVGDHWTGVDGLKLGAE